MGRKVTIIWLMVLMMAVMLIGCGKDKKEEDPGKDAFAQQTQDQEQQDPEPEVPDVEPEPEPEPEVVLDPMNDPTPYELPSTDLETVATTARVNVRVNSSMEAAVYTVVDAGTRFQRIEDEGEWTSVYHEGYRLYIASQYLKVQEDAAGVEAKNYTGDISTLETWYTTTGVNVRTGPSTDYPVYTTLAGGSAVDYISKEEGWCAIHYQGKLLYIYEEYLSESKNTEPVSETGSSSDDAESSETSSDHASQAGSQTVSRDGSYVIVIDPGHQNRANTEKEPNGPGSSDMKNKVTGGTTGTITGLAEYKLNLQVGLKLRDELEARGYTVIMTRESHDVDISNSERAQIANEAGADAFIRIHANGSSNPDTNGVMTICQTPSNPYNSEWYEESRKLSDLVLKEVVEATGAKKQYVWETDTMTGINWAEVPSTILEMGYMTNPTEDENMATEVYQYLIAGAVADAVDAFLGN